jgi:heme exporter protein A
VIVNEWSFFLLANLLDSGLIRATEPPWRESVLIASDLTIRRGDLLLCTQVNFRVSSGQILHIRGQNGIGKTTLLMMLAGLLPTSEIHEDKKRLVWAQATAVDWPVLYIGHLAGLNSGLSVAENLEFLQGINTSSEEGLSAALDQVGLSGYEDVAVSRLSSGQKRRVSLARLWLSNDSDTLWLLDEPFNALDAAMTRRLCQRLALHAELGGRVILTSHQTFMLSVQTLDLEQFAIAKDEEIGDFETVDQENSFSERALCENQA